MVQSATCGALFFTKTFLLRSILIFLKGFTKFYEFSSADMRAGADIINRLFMKSSKLKLLLHFTMMSEYLFANPFEKVSQYPLMLMSSCASLFACVRVCVCVYVRARACACLLHVFVFSFLICFS